jgi:hypothetical protein
MLPCGVRTFLFRRNGSDRPPSWKVEHPRASPKRKNCDGQPRIDSSAPRAYFRIVPARFLLPLLLLVSLPPALRAQLNTDGPIHMTPDLALAVPLVEVKHDVTLKFPILINATTVVKPGMVLRNIYIPPTNDDSENLAIAHAGTMADAYSRPASGNQPQMDPEIARQIEHQRRIVWDEPIYFQIALEQMPTDIVHLIYSQTGDELNLDDQRFNFFDGLFLGAPAGVVTVLALENGSKADKAGIKAGDQILSVNGRVLPADLAAFPTIYVAGRKDAEEMRAPSFPVVVRSTGEAGSHTVNIATPATIKSMLMEGL